MARSASVLTMKETKTKTISFKISSGLESKLDALDARLTTDAPDVEFDRAAICTAALEEAVALANAELDKKSKQ